MKNYMIRNMISKWKDEHTKRIFLFIFRFLVWLDSAAEGSDEHPVVESQIVKNL